MNSILQDVSYALRQLRKAPGFAITAVLTLALGIGANTAIFTLVHAVLLRNLPVADPSTLVRLGDKDDCCVDGGLPNEDNYSLFSWELYKHLQASSPEFENLAAMQSYPWQMTVLSNKPGSLAKGSPASFVSGNYFQTFGLQPYAGRLLTPADDMPGAPMVAVISYQSWQRDYGADKGIIGSTFYFKTQPAVIVGIAPPGFYGERMISAPANFYLPFSNEPMMNGSAALLHSKGSNWVYVLGRVKPGTQLMPLQDKLSAALRQWLADNVEVYKRADVKKHLDATHLKLTPGGAGIANMQDEYRSGLYLLLSISALVLLIACANLANLVLVRAMARATETSLRMALGAQRSRILRQMLTESVVLSLIGGLAGLGVAYGGTKMLLSLAFPNSPTLPITATPSLPVFGFAFALAMVTGVVFGLAPAWITARAQPAEALRGTGKGMGSARGNSSLLQRGLVVLQASLSLVLLVGAGLLSKSLGKLEHQDFGFKTENRVVIHMDPESAGYKPEQLQGLFDEITLRFHAIPGVEQVGIGGYSPLEGDSWGEGVWLNGKPEPNADQDIGSRWLRINPEMLPLLGEDVIAGRNFTDRDTAAAPGVAMVNQAWVKKFLKNGENPIGVRFGTNGIKSTTDYTIVGVVKNAKWANPREDAEPRYFRPLMQIAASQKEDGEVRSLHTGTIMLHTHGPIPGLESQARQVLASINANLPVTYYSTFEEQIAGQFSQERLIARLTLLFSGLALLLAAIGLYGVTAYMVARRTSEIGIRMALGANRGSVVAMVLRQALVQAVLGLVIGLPVALACVRFMKSQLYQVEGTDAAVIAFAIVALVVSACVAGIIPASRAAGIDPMVALRNE
jgi:macrolide transport system ATP-binding/permease protein